MEGDYSFADIPYICDNEISDEYNQPCWLYSKWGNIGKSRDQKRDENNRQNMEDLIHNVREDHPIWLGLVDEILSCINYEVNSCQ